MIKISKLTSKTLFVTYFTTISLATLLVAFFMLNPVATDTSATTSFNASVNRTGYTLSLELVGSNPGTVALSADTSAGGTWVAGKQTVRGTTNSPAGYQLYLSTTSASNALIGSDDSSNTIPSGGGTHSSPTTLAVNRWGYAIPDQTGYDGAFSGDYTIGSDGTISSSTTWATMPVASAPVLVDTVSGQPSGLVTTKDLNIYYGAAADISLASDTYLGTVLYSAISDLSVASESASISPTRQKITETNVSVNIVTPLLTTTDLATADVTATIGGQTCPVTAVSRNPASSDNPNAVVVTCTAPGSNIVAKKDVVVSIPKFNKTYTITEGYEYKSDPSNLNELETLQQLAEYPNICANATVGDTGNDIEDARDHKTYDIRKLADGNCWMIDNLRLGTVGQDLNLTSADTDLAPGTNSLTIPASQIENSGSAGWSSDYDTTYHIYNRETGTDIVNGRLNGNFYTWHTATAGSGNSSTTSGVEVDGSLCPKGWELPTTSGSTSFSNLYNIEYPAGSGTKPYNSASNLRRTGISGPEFTLSGHYDDGSGTAVSSAGYFWSSRAAGSSAGTLYLRASEVYPSSGTSQFAGLSIRCVFASSS